MTHKLEEPSGKTWLESVQPLLVKFEVAGALNGVTTFNSDGSKALANLLKTMAIKLDCAVELERARNADNDQT